MSGTLPAKRRRKVEEEFQDFYDAAERLCEDYENIFYFEPGFQPFEPHELVDYIREYFKPDEFKLLLETKVGRGIVLGVVIAMREMNYRSFIEGDDNDDAEY
jgi:hypothetical protein